MKKVGVAELKAKLSEYLRAARRGTEVTVLDRGEPIARLVAATSTAGLSIRPAAANAPRLKDVPLPPPIKSAPDVVELLLEDRRKR